MVDAEVGHPCEDLGEDSEEVEVEVVVMAEDTVVEVEVDMVPQGVVGTEAASEAVEVEVTLRTRISSGRICGHGVWEEAQDQSASSKGDQTSKKGNEDLQ